MGFGAVGAYFHATFIHITHALVMTLAINTLQLTIHRVAIVGGFAPFFLTRGITQTRALIYPHILQSIILKYNARCALHFIWLLLLLYFDL